jgi:hypothetical protein
MPSAAENLRDDLIEHDIRNRRVLGGLQREIERRQAILERRIRDAIIEIDPAGASAPRMRESRLRRLNERVSEITREVYAEHSSEIRAALRRIYDTEATATINAIAEAPEG